MALLRPFRPCGTQEAGMPGVQPPALAEGERAAWPVRPRTGGVPPLSLRGGCSRGAIRARGRRLTPRLCRTITHVRAGDFAGTLSALAAGKKAACLGCNPPPLRDARGRLGPCGHAPPAQARVRPDNCPRASARAPRLGLCGHAPACLGCNPREEKFFARLSPKESWRVPLLF